LKEEGRGTCLAQNVGNFVAVPLHFFGSTSIISRFGEHFRDSQYILASFLFAVLLFKPTVEESRRSGLVVTRLPAVREIPGSNRAADKNLVFSRDTQLWARASHLLQQCLGQLSLPPSEGC